MSLALPFDHQPRTRLVFGPGVVQRVGTLAKELNGSRVLLVTDPGIVKAGHAGNVENLLKNSGLEIEVYADVHENPTTLDVEACVRVAKEARIDLIVGLGGGSSMDTAKGCNFILTNGGVMKDYWGVGKATKAMLPLIAIPTTAGTGSECQSAALIADATTHQKMACLDSKAAAKVALLDPSLTLSQPARVTACTGLDAIAHALETAVTHKRNALSSAFSSEALRLCYGSFERVLSAPSDLEARGAMLLGAALAGLAIENSMLGAAHAAANPLTAHFGIVHGQAVGMLLPAVVHFNLSDGVAAALYADLSRSVGLDAVDHLSAKLQELLTKAGLPTRLSACGVGSDSIPMLADEASKQWTAHFNPKKVGVHDFAGLYQEIL